MIIYRFRPDMVYDCEVEVPDGTRAIPTYHTFQPPPQAPGHYAVMRGGWQLVPGEKPPYPPPPDPEYEKMRYNTEQKQRRAEAYARESDPLFFKIQRGEATMEEWLEKIQQIQDQYPYQ